MFNEICGKVINRFTYCKDCVFRDTRFCTDLNSSHPLFISCKDSEFLKSNIDIFEL